MLSDEDRSQFQNHRQNLFDEWRPGGATQGFFVELLAVTSNSEIRLVGFTHGCLRISFPVRSLALFW